MLKESLKKTCCILWLWLAAVGLVSPLSFSPVTEQVGLKDAAGFMTSFADFNADKATDVLVLNISDGSQSVYLWERQGYRFSPNLLPPRAPSGIPLDAKAADFDGDGVVDVLVLSQLTDSNCLLGTIHWSAVVKGRVEVEKSAEISTSVKTLLDVIDFDGDHLPDVLVTSCQDGLPMILKSNGDTRNFTEAPLYSTSSGPDSSGPDSPMDLYYASYFVDLNSDCLADIVIDGEIGSEDGGSRVLEVWLRRQETGTFEYSGRTSLPPPLNVSSSFRRKLAFADMDGDGVLEVLGMSCRAAEYCDKVFVSILYQHQFSGTDVLSCRASSSWKLSWRNAHLVDLAPGNHSDYLIGMGYGGEMSVGDVDLDGYPDVLTTAAYKGSVQALVLLNTRCKSDCNGSKVTLEPRWGLFGNQTNVSRAAFFDLEEDGKLDVLLMQWTTSLFPDRRTGAGGAGVKLLAFRQDFREDHAFLKVLALSGHCFSHCKSGMEPYGSVLPGAVVSFSTTDRNGGKKRSVATISRGSLQLPFVVFGLGQTPNFIEDLTIGAAHDGYGKIAYRQWSLLVPNSQVIVVTVPPTDASRWRLELYLTPSRLVYGTAAVLGSLFVGIAVLVLLLHGRERYQDSKERQQAKHRFHFNAM